MQHCGSGRYGINMMMWDYDDQMTGGWEWDYDDVRNTVVGRSGSPITALP